MKKKSIINLEKLANDYRSSKRFKDFFQAAKEILDTVDDLDGLDEEEKVKKKLLWNRKMASEYLNQNIIEKCLNHLNIAEGFGVQLYNTYICFVKAYILKRDFGNAMKYFEKAKNHKKADDARLAELLENVKEIAPMTGGRNEDVLLCGSSTTESLECRISKSNDKKFIFEIGEETYELDATDSLISLSKKLSTRYNEIIFIHRGRIIPLNSPISLLNDSSIARGGILPSKLKLLLDDETWNIRNI